MYNLVQRVNGQYLDIVDFSLYHYDLIYLMEVNHKGKLSFPVLQHLAVEALRLDFRRSWRKCYGQYTLILNALNFGRQLLEALFACLN